MQLKKASFYLSAFKYPSLSSTLTFSTSYLYFTYLYLYTSYLYLLFSFFLARLAFWGGL